MEFTSKNRVLKCCSRTRIKSKADILIHACVQLLKMSINVLEGEKLWRRVGLNLHKSIIVTDSTQLLLKHLIARERSETLVGVANVAHLLRFRAC